MGERLVQHISGHMASKEQRYKEDNFANAYPTLPKAVKYYLVKVRILVATKGHSIIEGRTGLTRVLCILDKMDFKTNTSQVFICKGVIVLVSAS